MREDLPVTTADTLVLPNSFGAALLGALGEKSSVNAITQASQRISRYHEKFWKSNLVLIPLQDRRHWVLAAVTNLHLARDRTVVKPPSQVPDMKDPRPDVSPFCVLVFNSLQNAFSVSPVIELLKEFLRYLWSAIHGGVLEYFDAHNVKVRTHSVHTPPTKLTFQEKCPQQLDIASCGLYVVACAEALMRAGVAERVRRSAQVCTISPILGYRHALTTSASREFESWIMQTTKTSSGHWKQLVLHLGK